VLVNDVVVNGGMPETPFGGIKQSGFGRVLGDDSLKELCNAKHVGVDRLATERDPLWFPYTDRTLSIARKAVKAVLGGGGVLKRLSALF
jgi:succinate-semialdehyde dehydrogenase/glutarate-semialdehyde dehydrogenase